MKKLLLLLTGTSFSLTFAEGIERAIRQVGPMPFLTAGAGGLTFLIGALLSYVAVSYGIYLLAKKYEPSLHPAWSWIPVANVYPAVKVSGQSLWWIVALLFGGIIPFIGPIITLGAAIFIYHKISERTGRGAGTTALLLFFSVIMLPWLGLTVNKKSTKTAWILGVAAILLTLIGTALAGVGAVSGFLHLNKKHNFMDKARGEMMKELQNNPTMREQMKEIQNQMQKIDTSTTVKVNAGTAVAK